MLRQACAGLTAGAVAIACALGIAPSVSAATATDVTVGATASYEANGAGVLVPVTVTCERGASINFVTGYLIQRIPHSSLVDHANPVELSQPLCSGSALRIYVLFSSDTATALHLGSALVQVGLQSCLPTGCEDTQPVTVVVQVKVIDFASEAMRTPHLDVNLSPDRCQCRPRRGDEGERNRALHGLSRYVQYCCERPATQRRRRASLERAGAGGGMRRHVSRCEISSSRRVIGRGTRVKRSSRWMCPRVSRSDRTLRRGRGRRHCDRRLTPASLPRLDNGLSFSRPTRDLQPIVCQELSITSLSCAVGAPSATPVAPARQRLAKRTERGSNDRATKPTKRRLRAFRDR